MLKLSKFLIKRWQTSVPRPSTKDVKVVSNDQDTSEIDTEKSYQAAHSASDCVEYYIRLYYHPLFMFIATLANVVLFAKQTYKKIFINQMKEAHQNKWALTVEMICYLIIFVEILSSIMHRFCKKLASKYATKPRNMMIIIVDLIVQVMCVAFAQGYQFGYVYTYIFELFRLFRVFVYFHLISVSPGKRTLLYTLSKFGLIIFVVSHIAATLAAIISFEYENTNVKTWLKELKLTFKTDDVSPIQFYTYCLFSVLAAVAALGSTPASAENDAETILLVSLMIIGLVFVNGVLLGACTSIRIDIYIVKAIFHNKLKLINKNLNESHMAKKIKFQINNYYLEFWNKEHATSRSKLFGQYPEPIRKCVLVDKYWMTFNDGNFFPKTHTGFKRSLSLKMESIILTTREVLCTQYAQKSTLMYIARGSIQLLSAEDMETPLVTLGVGTFIGEMNLICTTKNPVQIIASSYCVIHCLNKADLFRVCAKYKKMQQSQILHGQFKKILTYAKENRMKKSISSSSLPFEKIVARGTLGNSDIKSLYVLSEEFTEKNREDEIFYKTKFPWILQANSTLIFYWDIIIVIGVLFVSIGLPLYIAFHGKDTIFFYVSYHYVQLFYTLDVLIQSVVVTEDENGIHTKLSEIFLVKLTSFRFLLDLIAAIPAYVIFSVIKVNEHSTNSYLISFLRLLKLHKVVLMFSKIENSFKFNIAALRLFKYIVYFLYLTFLFSIVYYLVACTNYVCSENSWVAKLREMHPETTPLQVYFNSFQASLLLLILSGGGEIIFSNMMEVACLLFFVICGIMICTYIASDYAATLTLQDYSKTQYRENVMVINKLSQSEPMRTSENLRNINRIYDYFLSQWRFIGGYSLKHLLEDAPSHLYDTQQIEKYSQDFEKLYPFRHLGQSFHNALATKAELVYFSPNEIFVYANEPSTAMFILQQGYCELMTCRNKRLDKIIDPGTDICLVEVLLGMNNSYFVRPITSVALLKVTKKDIAQIFRDYTTLEDFLQNYRAELKNSVLQRKVFGDQEIEIASNVYDTLESSFFRFPNDKTRPLYRHLIKGWGRFIIFRYVMLPWTIMPEGRFIVMWEIIYNVSLFFLIMLSLVTDVYYWASPDIDNFVYALESIQLISMYIRFHVCYYDKNGVLITHHKSTAEHYLTGAFLVDFIAIIPMSRLYSYYNFQPDKKLYYKGIFNTNKLLQLYRLPLMFFHFTRDELKPQGILLNVLKFLPMSMIYLNLCVSFLFAISTTIVFRNDTVVMETVPHSIVDYMVHLNYFEFDTHSPGDAYLIILYWVTATTMQLGFTGVSPTRNIDVIVSTGIALIGYLLFTYILVIIANSQTTINSQLTIHQSRMKHVVKFMKEERVQRSLQIKAIEYFEYRWQRHHGFTVTDIVNKCHHVLYEDFLYDQYKQIFIKVQIFTDLQNTIYRNLSLHLHHVYFLSDVPFIKINDIVSNIYIVYRGEVTVFNAINKLCDVLGPGTIIGNIDNVNYTRSMLTYMSNGSIELLEIETKIFYSIVSPSAIYKLQKHLLLDNLSFIKGTSMKTALSRKWQKKQKFVKLTRKQTKKLRILTSMTLNMLFTLCSYGSICASLYVIAYINLNYMVLQMISIYTLDLVHILIVIVKFLTPFYDATGQFITSTKLIKKRLVRQPWFYLNVLATVPLELSLILISPSNYERSVIFRGLLINRCLRFYNILKFFNEFNDMLNSDLLFMKLTSIFIYVTLLLHAQTCVLYVIATNGTNEFNKGSWAYHSGEYAICGNSYLCTLYFSTSILTMSGYHITIRSKLNVITVMLFIIVDKILTAIFVAQLSACIQNYSSDLIAFDAKYVSLKVYLKRCFISKPLIKQIISYTGQLWLKSKGVQKPVLLATAPLYLQEQVKSDIYGKHINNNLVFAKCHRDFLRHLIKCLTVETYFLNDTICEQGDINETMYFIHRGSIDAFYATDTEEIKVDELQELDCFGIIQGLFPRTPHTHTFRATTVTMVLTLKLTDWFYILNFFPASKYYIYNKLNSLSSAYCEN